MHREAGPAWGLGHRLVKGGFFRGTLLPPSHFRPHCDGLVASPAVPASPAAAAGGRRCGAGVPAGNTPRGGGPLRGREGDAAGGPAGTSARARCARLLPHPRLRRGRPGSGGDAARVGAGRPTPHPRFNPDTLAILSFPFPFPNWSLSRSAVPPPHPPAPPGCIEHLLCTSGAGIRVSSFRPGEAQTSYAACAWPPHLLGAPYWVHFGRGRARLLLVRSKQMPWTLNDSLTDVTARRPSAVVGSQHLLGAASAVALGGVQWAR